MIHINRNLTRRSQTQPKRPTQINTRSNLGQLGWQLFAGVARDARRRVHR